MATVRYYIRVPTANTSDTGSRLQNDGGSGYNSGSYGRLDDVPLSAGTDYVTQTTTSATTFLDLDLGDTTKPCVLGVSATVAYESSTATGTVTGTTNINDAGTDRTIYSGNMKVGATRTYRTATVPPTGAWTTAKFNALTARIGYATISGGSPGPPPYWESIVVEYAWN